MIDPKGRDKKPLANSVSVSTICAELLWPGKKHWPICTAKTAKIENS